VNPAAFLVGTSRCDIRAFFELESVAFRHTGHDGGPIWKCAPNGKCWKISI